MAASQVVAKWSPTVSDVDDFERAYLSERRYCRAGLGSGPYSSKQTSPRGGIAVRDWVLVAYEGSSQNIAGTGGCGVEMWAIEISVRTYLIKYNNTIN